MTAPGEVLSPSEAGGAASAAAALSIPVAMLATAAKLGVSLDPMTSSSQNQIASKLRKEFDNGHTYYALEAQQLLDPRDATARPSQELLAWHSEAVFRGG